VREQERARIIAQSLMVTGMRRQTKMVSIPPPTRAWEALHEQRRQLLREATHRPQLWEREQSVQTGNLGQELKAVQ